LAGWERVTLLGADFLLMREGGVSFLHSMGERDYREHLERERLRKALGLSCLVKARQVHGDMVLEAGGIKGEGEADGLLLSLQDREMGIAVLTADCLPLLMAAPQHLLLLHVGWRGLARGIVHKGIEMMKGLYSDVENFKIYFGPYIKRCCYRVGWDMIGELRRSLPPEVVEAGMKRDWRGLSFSLGDAISKILELEGMGFSLKDSGFCTCCSGLFPSYRREGEGTPRMINLAWREIW